MCNYGVKTSFKLILIISKLFIILISGSDSLDNIHISVLAQEEVSHSLPHKAVGDASVPVPCEGQLLDQTTTITAAAPESQNPNLAGCETVPLALTPATGDSRKSARLGKQREGKEKHRNLGAKFWVGRDLSKKQRREEFHSKVDRWTQKLSSSSNILEVRLRQCMSARVRLVLR